MYFQSFFIRSSVRILTNYDSKFSFVKSSIRVISLSFVNVILIVIDCFYEIYMII